MVKKIIVLGANSPTAKEFCKHFTNNIEILKFSHHKADDNQHQFDLNNISYQDIDIIKKFQADTLINFAWLSVTSTTYNSHEHLDNYIGSLLLIKEFIYAGGKNLIGIGTCYEYGEKYKSLINEVTIPQPTTYYASIRLSLYSILNIICKRHDINFTWARLFSNYGVEKNERRLTKYLISNFLNDKPVHINEPFKEYDYIYFKDVAKLLFLITTAEKDLGVINLCTSKGTSILDYALTIQKLLGKKDLILYDANNKNNIKVVGDNSKLLSTVGDYKFYTVEEGLSEIIEHCI